MPTRVCISRHLRDSAYLVTAKSGPFKNILACLHVEFSVHNSCCSLCAQAREAALIEHIGTPKIGSGPINVLLAAFFTRPSTAYRHHRRKIFLLWLGNSQNQLHYSVREPPTPVTMETALGFLVKAHGTDVIWLGSWISIHKNITMNDSSGIINLPEPSTGGEPATKSYVDLRKPIITIWAEKNL